jgi:hypothetical protein
MKGDRYNGDRSAFFGFFTDLLFGNPKLLIEISLEEMIDFYETEKSYFGIKYDKRSIIITKNHDIFDFDRFPKYERKKLLEAWYQSVKQKEVEEAIWNSSVIPR